MAPSKSLPSAFVTISRCMLLLFVLLSPAPTKSFTTPSRTIARPLILPSSRGGFSLHRPNAPLSDSVHCFSHAAQKKNQPSPSSSTLFVSNDLNNQESNDDAIFSSPLDRPLLAIVDTISLIIFAAIGKSSHSSDGSLDIIAILITAFPFVSAWLATSPLTKVYSPDDRGEDSNFIASTIVKVGKGWVVAIPLGIVLRGVIKGYVPPVPFMVVTLISTLVILAGVRVVFSVAEDFFVELVN